MASKEVPAVGCGEDGVYRLMRSVVAIPSDPALSLSLNDLIFRHADTLVDTDTGSALTFAALAAAEARTTMTNPLYTAREMANQVADARVGLIVRVSDLLPKVVELQLPAILLDGDATASVTVPFRHQRYALLGPLRASSTGCRRRSTGAR